MSKDDLLLVGATGFLGRALLPLLTGRHRITAVRFRSPEYAAEARWVRISAEAGAAERLVRGASPRVIVNVAALASLADGRENPALARNLNVELPAALATAAAATGARLLHISTDQVFDGRKGHYAETDEPAPISVYGETKLAGERVVLAEAPDAVVLRVNLVCGRSTGTSGSSVDQILARAAAGEEIRLFTDEFRSPVAVSDVVRAAVELVASEYRGLLHLGGPRLSRYILGRALLEKHGMASQAVPVTLDRYDGPPRARDTSFNTTRAREILASPPGGLEAILEDC